MHRPTITAAAQSAINLLESTRNSMRFFLLVILGRRPSATRPEASSYVRGAKVMSFERFGCREDDMRERLKVETAAMQHNSPGKRCGALSAICFCEEMWFTNCIPIGWDDELLQEVSERLKGEPWKEWMTKKMNSGLVD